MVADMIEAGELEFQSGWVGREQRLKIEAACAKLGLARLRALKDDLPAETTFDEIRLVVADLRRQKSQAPAREDR